MKFWKLSGSGNDFVFLDAIGDPRWAARAADPAFTAAVCAAHTGVGADGVAVLQAFDGEGDFALDYFNRDGSIGELCGNASLCAVRLATELGYAAPSSVTFQTGAGMVRGRLAEGVPAVDLQPVTDLRPDAGIDRFPAEDALGYAHTGVPHLVVRVDDIEAIPIAARGPELRHHASLAAGANVNWVAKHDGQWHLRTFERGVESETLACGTGAVAVAALLRSWGLAGDRVGLRTRSGKVLEVTLHERAGRWHPTLRGEGRIVFEGSLRDL